jgi:hypothetical protein
MPIQHTPPTPSAQPTAMVAPNVHQRHKPTPMEHDRDATRGYTSHGPRSRCQCPRHFDIYKRLGPAAGWCVGWFINML